MSNSARNRPSGESPAKTARATARSDTAEAAAGGAKTRKKATAAAPSRQPTGARRARATKPSKANGAKAASVPDQLQPLIAAAAYFIAEREGFPAGRELEHWLQAEIEVLEGLQPD